jgi:hypothetical protein
VRHTAMTRRPATSWWSGNDMRLQRSSAASASSANPRSTTCSDSGGLRQV